MSGFNQCIFLNPGIGIGPINLDNTNNSMFIIVLVAFKFISSRSALLRSTSCVQWEEKLPVYNPKPIVKIDDYIGEF